jgi:soluble lytic murein transglycosylase-like protein
MIFVTKSTPCKLLTGIVFGLAILVLPVAVSAAQPKWQAPIVNYLRFESIVYQTAKQHDMEVALVNAVIHTESYFNPKACSNKGACGLMQLIPTTAAQYGVTDVFNPRQNIEAGVRYLKDLLARYENNIVLALAAYNAGETAVDKYNGVPPYDETREYVKKVMKNYAVYSDWP